MENVNWTTNNIPSQQGKTFLITGANSGLGFEATKVLSKKGAHIIMTARNLQKGNEALEAIKKENPNAKLDLMQLDLADFYSIRNFSNEFHSKYSKLDVLVNNTGVMNPPKREVTKQHFSVQFGTNHLGHFLLTGLLLDILKNTPNSRVSVQSIYWRFYYFKKNGKYDHYNWFNCLYRSNITNSIFSNIYLQS